MRGFSAHRLATAAMLVMAALWGSTFFVLKDLVDRLPAPDLLFLRFALAFVVLAVITPRSLRMDRATLVKGLSMGAAFSVAQVLQTSALPFTSASISGFVTGLYVVATPLLAAVFLGKRITRVIGGAAVLATVGMGILSLTPSAGGTGPGVGELMTFVAALAFAGHIILAGEFATPKNSMSLTIVQTGVLVVTCGIFAAPGGLTVPTSALDWGRIAYLGVLCGALTLFLQIWAQAHVEPTRAAVIMSSEPVWAAFFAILLGGELLDWRILVGGAAVMAASWLVIRPQRRFSRPVRVPEPVLEPAYVRVT